VLAGERIRRVKRTRCQCHTDTGLPIVTKQMLSRKSSTVEKSLASQPPGKKLVPTIAFNCFHQPDPTFQRPTVNEIITYKTTDRTTRLLAAPTRVANSRTGSGGQFSPGQPVCQQRSVASASQRPHLWCQKLTVVKAPPGSKGSPSAGQRVLSVFFLNPGS